MAALRRRMARTLEECAEKYEKPRLPGFRRTPELFESTPVPDHSFHVEEWLPGEEVETTAGRHYETETLYARHRRHGSADIGALRRTFLKIYWRLFRTARCAACRPTSGPFWIRKPQAWREATGTCAFLVGVGRITPEGFRVRQFFMRDYGEMRARWMR